MSERLDDDNDSKCDNDENTIQDEFLDGEILEEQMPEEEGKCRDLDSDIINKSPYVKWHDSFNTKIRLLIKMEIQHEDFRKLFIFYLRSFKENLPYLLPYPKRCRCIAKKMTKILLLFRSLYSHTTEIDLYNAKMCELLSILTTLELKNASNFDEPKIKIVNRLCVNYDIHLKDLDVSHILRVFLYLNRNLLFDQKEVLTKIFGKYLKKFKRSGQNELNDKLYCMYLVSFSLWVYIETDSYEKNIIKNYANQVIAPKPSLRSNSRYAPFLPQYSAQEKNITKLILDKGFNRIMLVKALIADDSYEDAIINLCEEEEPLIIDLDIDVPEENFENLQISTIIKREKPELIATIDLTEEIQEVDNKTNPWLEKLIKFVQQSKKSILHPEKNTEVINLDDSDVEIENEMPLVENSTTTIPCEENENQSSAIIDNINSEDLESEKEPKEKQTDIQDNQTSADNNIDSVEKQSPGEVQLKASEKNLVENIESLVENIENSFEIIENQEKSVKVNENKENSAEVMENKEKSAESIENKENSGEVMENKEKSAENIENKENSAEVMENKENSVEVIEKKDTPDANREVNNPVEMKTNSNLQVVVDGSGNESVNNETSVVGTDIDLVDAILNSQNSNEPTQILITEQTESLANISATKAPTNVSISEDQAEENNQILSNNSEIEKSEILGENLNDVIPIFDEDLSFVTSYASRTYSKQKRDTHRAEKHVSRILTDDDLLSEIDKIEEDEDQSKKQKQRVDPEKIVHSFSAPKKVNFAPLPDKYGNIKKVTFEDYRSNDSVSNNTVQTSFLPPSGTEAFKIFELQKDTTNPNRIANAASSSQKLKNTVAGVGSVTNIMQVTNKRPAISFANGTAAAPIKTTINLESRPTASSILAATGVKPRGNTIVTGMSKDLNFSNPGSAIQDVNSDMNAHDFKRLNKDVVSDTFSKNCTVTSVESKNCDLDTNSTVGHQNVILACKSESDNNLSSNSVNFKNTLNNKSKCNTNCSNNKHENSDFDNDIHQKLSGKIAIFSQHFSCAKEIDDGEYSEEGEEEDEESILTNADDSEKSLLPLIQEADYPDDMDELEQLLISSTYDDSSYRDITDNICCNKKVEGQTSLPLKKRRKLSTFSENLVYKDEDLQFLDFQRIKATLDEVNQKVNQQQQQLQQPTLNPFLDRVSYPSTPMLSIANFENLICVTGHLAQQTQQQQQMINNRSTQQQQQQHIIQPNSLQFQSNNSTNPLNLQTINILPAQHATIVGTNNGTNTLRTYNILPDQAQTIGNNNNRKNTQKFSNKPCIQRHSNSAVNNISIPTNTDISSNNMQVNSRNIYNSNSTDFANFNFELYKETVSAVQNMNVLPNNVQYANAMHCNSHAQLNKQFLTNLNLQANSERQNSTSNNNRMTDEYQNIPNMTRNNCYGNAVPSKTVNMCENRCANASIPHSNKSETKLLEIDPISSNNYNLNHQHLNNFLFNSRSNFDAKQSFFNDINRNVQKQQQQQQKKINHAQQQQIQQAQQQEMLQKQQKQQHQIQQAQQQELLQKQQKQQHQIQQERQQYLESLQLQRNEHHHQQQHQHFLRNRSIQEQLQILQKQNQHNMQQHQQQQHHQQQQQQELHQFSDSSKSLSSTTASNNNQPSKIHSKPSGTPYVISRFSSNRFVDSNMPEFRRSNSPSLVYKPNFYDYSLSGSSKRIKTSANVNKQNTYEKPMSDFDLYLLKLRESRMLAEARKKAKRKQRKVPEDQNKKKSSDKEKDKQNRPIVAAGERNKSPIKKCYVRIRRPSELSVLQPTSESRNEHVQSPMEERDSKANSNSLINITNIETNTENQNNIFKLPAEVPKQQMSLEPIQNHSSDIFNYSVDSSLSRGSKIRIISQKIISPAIHEQKFEYKNQPQNVNLRRNSIKYTKPKESKQIAAINGRRYSMADSLKSFRSNQHISLLENPPEVVETYCEKLTTNIDQNVNEKDDQNKMFNKNNESILNKKLLKAGCFKCRNCAVRLKRYKSVSKNGEICKTFAENNFSSKRIQNDNFASTNLNFNLEKDNLLPESQTNDVDKSSTNVNNINSTNQVQKSLPTIDDVANETAINLTIANHLNKNEIVARSLHENCDKSLENIDINLSCNESQPPFILNNLELSNGTSACLENVLDSNGPKMSNVVTSTQESEVSSSLDLRGPITKRRKSHKPSIQESQDHEYGANAFDLDCDETASNAPTTTTNIDFVITTRKRRRRTKKIDVIAAQLLDNNLSRNVNSNETPGQTSATNKTKKNNGSVGQTKNTLAATKTYSKNNVVSTVFVPPDIEEMIHKDIQTQNNSN